MERSPVDHEELAKKLGINVPSEADIKELQHKIRELSAMTLPVITLNQSLAEEWDTHELGEEWLTYHQAIAEQLGLYEEDEVSQKERVRRLSELTQVGVVYFSDEELNAILASPEKATRAREAGLLLERL